MQQRARLPQQQQQQGGDAVSSHYLNMGGEEAQPPSFGSPRRRSSERIGLLDPEAAGALGESSPPVPRKSPDVETNSIASSSSLGYSKRRSSPAAAAAVATSQQQPEFTVVPKVLGIHITRRRKLCLFWCLGVSLLLAAILVPVLLFVVAPRIAQSSIDASDLKFSSVAIRTPRNDSFLLSSAGTITGAGFLDASISFPSPVSVYWTNRDNGAPDVQLGTMSLPPISVSGSVPKSGVLSLSGVRFDITDQAMMGNFSAFLIKGSSFSWRLKGSAAAQALGLTFSNLNMNKVVTLDGFNGLKNVSIDAFNLPSSDPTQGIILQTNTTLVNPAQISIELGDLAFDSFFGETKIGDLVGKNISLVPGANMLALNGHIIPMKDTTGLSQVFTFFVGGKGSSLGVVGTSVVGPEGPVNWLNAGFDGLSLSVTLNPPSGQQQLVSNIQIPGMSVTFNPNDPTGGYNLLVTAPTISAYFQSPFDFPLTISTAAQSLNFVDKTSNKSFANVQVPFVPAIGDQYKHTLSTAFTNANLTVIPGNEDTFGQFFKALTVGDAYTVGIQGLVSTQASTAAGEVTISNVSLTDSLTLHGFQGLNQVSIGAVDVSSGDAATGIHLTIATTIQNPSNLSLNVNADVSLNLLFKDQSLGTVVLPALSLVPGANVINAKSSFFPQTSDQIATGRILLSQFLSGAASAVSIVGSATSTPYKSLAASFNGLTINTNLPGQSAKLITSSYLNFNSVLTTTAPVYLQLFNPLSAPFSLVALKATITYSGQIIGYIDADLSGNPVVVGGGASAMTPPINANLVINIISLQALLNGLSGQLVIDASSTITAKVGDYQTVVDYSQTGVKTVLGAP